MSPISTSSPAHWTWRTIESQGFRIYCGGRFFSFPALSRPKRGLRIEVVGEDARATAGLSEAEAALLVRHATYGCLSLVCRAADGRGFPFVLQPMRIWRIPLLAMQMIYCRDVADYLACAGVIGRFLLRRGRISLALDAMATSRAWPASTGSRSAANTSRDRSVPGLPICQILNW